MNSFENEKLEIVESLFADDTTILGTKDEIFIGRDSVMDVMNMFEEKCHPDKEEPLFLGESESESIRMLGSFFGRKKDNQERLKRARQGVEGKETIMEDKNEQNQRSKNCRSYCGILSTF